MLPRLHDKEGSVCTLKQQFENQAACDEICGNNGSFVRLLKSESFDRVQRHSLLTEAISGLDVERGEDVPGSAGEVASGNGQREVEVSTQI